jgi:hypothetical protein
MGPENNRADSEDCQLGHARGFGGLKLTEYDLMRLVRKRKRPYPVPIEGLWESRGLPETVSRNLISIINAYSETTIRVDACSLGMSILHLGMAPHFHIIYHKTLSVCLTAAGM